MAFAVRALVLLLSVSLLPGFGPGAETQGPVQKPYRVEITLVTVPVILSDPAGQSVTGMQISDFTLYQDGVPQKIALFATAEEPINIALLLDTSKSTASVLPKIKKAARNFLRNLRPQDRAVVISFDSEVQALSPLTSDYKELEEGIKSASVARYVGTKLRDAVLGVTERRFKSVQGRKAIVLLSDGQDYGSGSSIAELLDSVGAGDTVIYTVFYPVDPRALMKKLFGVSPRSGASVAEWREREEKAAAFLNRLSEATAGRTFRSEIGDLRTTFAMIAAEMRHQYLLGFYPDAAALDGSVRELQVTTSRPELIVRHRRSYRAAPPAEDTPSPISALTP